MTPAPRFFDYRSDFQAAIRDVLATAQLELLLFDPDYDDWAINSPDVPPLIETFLNHSVRAKLRMVIRDPEQINRAYPRIANLLRLHSNKVECRGLPEQYARLSETMIIADATHALRRPVATGFKGVLRLLDPDYAGGQRDRFEELWSACHDRFSSTSLGLG
ncbi:hypothetical protein BH09PSE6_BH09PSE6_07060 [soil metagenome]